MNQATTFALITFAITYILIFAFQKIRPYVAIASAIVFIAVGSLNLVEGFSYDIFTGFGQIDWNVLLMIIGTMGTVQLFIDSNMPNLLSDIILSKVKSVKWMIVIMSLFAGIISAFVDNVATVLMIAPVALAICKKLGINPTATIICISISSNLQGAATLVGDTTSILLAKAANLDFTDFFATDGKLGMFFVTEAGAILAALIILLMFNKENGKIDVADRTVVEDKFPTYLLVLTIVFLIGTSFIPYKSNAASGEFYKPEISNGLICMFFFIVGLVRNCIKEGKLDSIGKAIDELDYYTLFLLLGLFIVIGGVEKAGVIKLLADKIFELCGGNTRAAVFATYTIIVWVSVLLSAFIDNIPYVATMLPVVAFLNEQFVAAGLNISPNLLYFGLLVGATLGGNITPVGASANITGIGILRKEGYNVRAKDFMKYSVPFTLTAVITGYVLVWLIWM